ncbi:MAG TPA: hypothetical protein ENG03_03740 [Thioploca sp.]|nr:MAG: hypothetical protein B6247_08685 [Beggiatoa sp. 4572_84]RKZ60248.1 MAG: hypothetical protein DRR08_11805 [Gammaproteobacteria bacterium]HDN26203.1 hypothetical protein [Thioploca sp.]
MLQSLTTNLSAIAVTLHVLSAVIWVGGMFFAHFALRPAAASLLEPPLRLPLMSQVLARFFPWVWVAVVLLWATGLWRIFGSIGGMGNAAIYIHIMLTIAAVMTALFAYIFFRPFPGLKQAVAQGEFKQAGKHLATIRQLIHTNLWLGLITIIVATGGRMYLY